MYEREISVLAATIIRRIRNSYSVVVWHDFEKKTQISTSSKLIGFSLRQTRRTNNSITINYTRLLFELDAERKYSSRLSEQSTKRTIRNRIYYNRNLITLGAIIIIVSIIIIVVFSDGLKQLPTHK